MIWAVFFRNVRKKCYYAVQNGRSAGVYNDWNSCNSQVSGYSGGVYKKFDSLAAAQNFASSTGGYAASNNTSSSTSSSSGGSYGRSYNSGYTRTSYNKTLSSSRSYGSSSNSGNNSSSYDNSSYDDSYYSSPQSNSYYAPTISVASPSTQQPTRSTPTNSGSNNYYAVKSSNPALPSKVFNNWNECQSYVHRQRGMSFKKFDSLESANNFAIGSVDSSVDYGLIGSRQSDFEQRYAVNSGDKFNKQCNVYCDGSSLGNGTSTAQAGYGAYFENEPHNNISERLRNGPQTNNRGEIEAVSSALDKIWTNLNQQNDKTNYKIKTDSEYVAKLLNDRYGSYSQADLQNLPNADLAVPMVQKYAKVKKYYEINKDSFANNGEFSVEWVKGHSGHQGNEMADELARRGAAKQ